MSRIAKKPPPVPVLCQRYTLLIRTAGRIHYETLDEARRVAALHSASTPELTRAAFDADRDQHDTTTIIDEGPCGVAACTRCAAPVKAPAKSKPVAQKSDQRTKAQNKALHALAGQRGMTHEDLHALAAEVSYGRTESTRELTFKEANQLITRLGGRAFAESSTPRRTLSYRRRAAGITGKSILASPAQKELIGQLAERRGITADGLERLARRMKLSYPPKTSAGAQALIEALKAMTKRGPLVKKEAA